jgi:hypothetical protein
MSTPPACPCETPEPEATAAPRGDVAPGGCYNAAIRLFGYGHVSGTAIWSTACAPAGRTSARDDVEDLGHLAEPTGRPGAILQNHHLTWVHLVNVGRSRSSLADAPRPVDGLIMNLFDCQSGRQPTCLIMLILDSVESDQSSGRSSDSADPEASRVGDVER